ncbi:asparagine synthase-related protein [Dyella sp.]|jgi:asparagine synthetase B (glutamine-hydrolysing)|uniref:asparagine synthase-related protein n=1 Tax=Dyella sp. TaxID=1869338 RepID=UPI002D7A04B5|nr:asparagine synthase-related protein [Dyella sp.]HET6431610.1 asparagine synthase-related protein [Dyella sp.]
MREAFPGHEAKPVPVACPAGPVVAADAELAAARIMPGAGKGDGCSEAMGSTQVRAGSYPTAPAHDRIQVDASPHRGEADFSAMRDMHGQAEDLDPVSMADLLRNAFVYPPHSIFRNVKLATTGFMPQQDLHDAPTFHFERQSAAVKRPTASAIDDERLVDTYHRLLCEAVTRNTERMRTPYLLQSGGKDSTSLAIAMSEAAPQVVCMTYLGGREENEVDSAQRVAQKLGLRHESLTCDPGRAYDRYLALVPRMPLLTADFALLSYCDLATEIARHGGDGIIDGLGSDPYFGVPPNGKQRLLASLARRVRLPSSLQRMPLMRGSFPLSYVLGTLQMDSFERFYPGSRFTDAEVDALLGRSLSWLSRQRLETFRADIDAARTGEARRRISATILEPALFAKGMYVASALDLRMAYPYCDGPLCDWVFQDVPDEQLIGAGGINKVLVRKHIARRFGHLPYVAAKGSFRFDLCGLAHERFDQVWAMAQQTRGLVPGAPAWLERYRHQLGNKYFASKFYLLAILLPWLLQRFDGALAQLDCGDAS